MQLNIVLFCNDLMVKEFPNMCKHETHFIVRTFLQNAWGFLSMQLFFYY